MSLILPSVNTIIRSIHFPTTKRSSWLRSFGSTIISTCAHGSSVPTDSFRTHSLRRALTAMIVRTVFYSFLTAVAPSPSGITHVDITELGFIRSLARYFYDTRFASSSVTLISINLDDYFTKQHTIDSLYKLAFPDYNAVQLAFYSLPLKFTLDFIMTQNALVDFEPQTKILSAAHFDSEAFMNGSRRILKLRGAVVADALTAHADLTHARAKLGQLLHTLQDFYSHSNWVEMGKTDINDLIGRNETIGLVAAPKQATCSDTGCTKKTLKCVRSAVQAPAT